MPRKSSDSYVTHRIELGVKERKMLEQYQIPKQVESVARASGYVVGAGAVALAAVGLYWFFDAGWGIRSKIRNHVDDIIERENLNRDDIENVADRAERSLGWTPSGIGIRISNWVLGI